MTIVVLIVVFVVVLFQIPYTIIYFVHTVQTCAIKFEIAKTIKFILTICLNRVGSILNVRKRTKDIQTIDVIPTYGSRISKKEFSQN